MRTQQPTAILFVAVMPALITSVPAGAAPDYWDPRLTQVCGLYLEDKAPAVPLGQGYWRLTRGEFQNEQESGGNHHIFYKCLDINGSPIENQKVWTSWSYTNETGSTYQFTKGPLDSYWGNFPMYVGTCAGTAMCGPTAPGPWPYNAYVDPAGSPRGYAGPSDKVLGMGMTSPQGTHCGAHVNFLLTWRWTLKAVSEPQIQRSPSSLAASTSQGFNPNDDLFTIRNTGGGTLNYNISDNADWLSISPSSGNVTGSEVDSITISYATSDLDIGDHNATITITGNATNSPQTLLVTCSVHSATYRGDFDGDGDVDLEDFSHLQLCLAGPGVLALPACTDARLDGDVDVDQDDADLFAMCISGSGNRPDSPCLR